MDTDVVPYVLCTVAVYERKNDKREYANYIGISTSSTPRKIFGKVLISRMLKGTKE